MIDRFLKINQFDFSSISLMERAKIVFFALLPLLLVVPSTLLVSQGIASVDYQWYGLDASWILALNLAFKNGWIFGKDFVITYGPLAFLATKNDLGVSSMYIMAFQAFIFVQAFILNYLYLRNRPGYSTAFLLFFTYFILFNICETNVILFFLVLVSIFYFQLATLNQYPGLVILAIINCVLVFFIKQNVGIYSIPITLYLLSVLYFTKSIGKKQFLFYVFFLFSLLFIMTNVFHVSLVPYILLSFHIVKDYNYVMYDYNFPNMEALILMLTFFVIFTFYVSIRYYKERHFKLFHVPLVLAFIAFACYKQSVVRSDNVIFFLRFFPMIFLVFLYQLNGMKYRSGIILYFICIGICIYQLTNYVPLLQRQGSYTSREANFTHMRYLLNFGFDDKSAAYKERCTKMKLPDKILSKIGSSLIDIIPWDIAYAYVNSLNYHPRPMFQSYQAYNYILDSINSEHFLDKQRAPEFVLFSFKSIDNRNPWFEETRTLSAVLNNYKVIDTTRSENEILFLFKRNEILKRPVIKMIGSKQIELGENCDVRMGTSNFIRIKVGQNLIGKMRSVFYKPPLLNMAVRNNINSESKCRVNIPTLENGMMVEPVIFSQEEFEDFLGLRKNQVASSSFRIEPVEWHDAWPFSKKIEVGYYEVKFE